MYAKKKDKTVRYYYSDSEANYKMRTGDHYWRPIIALIDGKVVVFNIATHDQERPDSRWTDLKLLATTKTDTERFNPIRLSDGSLTAWAIKNGYTPESINDILRQAEIKRRDMRPCLTQAQHRGRVIKKAYRTRTRAA